MNINSIYVQIIKFQSNGKAVKDKLFIKTSQYNKLGATINSYQ